MAPARHLSANSGVGIATIKRLEKGPTLGRVSAEMFFAVKAALERTGIEFQGEVGVSLRKPERDS